MILTSTSRKSSCLPDPCLLCNSIHTWHPLLTQSTRAQLFQHFTPPVPSLSSGLPGAWPNLIQMFWSDGRDGRDVRTAYGIDWLIALLAWFFARLVGRFISGLIGWWIDCLDWWVYVNSKFSFILKCRIAGPNRKATSCHTSSSQILHTKCPLQQTVFTPETCKPKGFLDKKPFASVYTKILIHDLDISSTWLWHDWDVKQTCEIWLGDDGDMTRTLGHHQNRLRHERDMTGTWQIHDQDITGTWQHHDGETTCRRRGTLLNDSISYLATATKRRPLRPRGP